MAKRSSVALDRHRVVSRPDWLAARARLLRREKSFSDARERLAAERREMPWVMVDRKYTFEGPKGTESMADLFGGRSQLVVYHFMFDPAEKKGCAHCSFWADNFNPIIVHLKQRDVTMLAISRAPLKKLEAFKKRMGWTFKWVSCGKSDFNYDFNVSFTPDEVRKDAGFYNYRKGPVWCEDREGISVFYRNRDGEVFHTYSCFARGIDMMNTAYQYLDLVPRGRDEGERPQSWVDYHDKYRAKK
jgi:predicted dithiol-disulfide oxidoreductase (DUF899 family)